MSLFVVSVAPLRSSPFAAFFAVAVSLVGTRTAAAQTPDATGCDVDAIEKFISHRLYAIDGCYKREWKLDPSLKGHVGVRFSIGVNGHVSDDVEISSKSTLHNDAVITCIKTTVHLWAFPIRGQTCPLNYEFLLDPVSGPKFLAAASVPAPGVCPSLSSPPSNCSSPGAGPDRRCTPGVGGEAGLGGTDDFETVCHASIEARRCDFPVEVRRTVFAAYGLEYPKASGTYELDNLIPLELGGSNDLRNLWPQPLAPAPGAHEKDQLENTLHRLYCEGRLSLAEARNAVAKDWVSSYRKYVLRNDSGGTSPTTP
jgi:hypothetical protein